MAQDSTLEETTLGLSGNTETQIEAQLRRLGLGDEVSQRPPKRRNTERRKAITGTRYIATYVISQSPERGFGYSHKLEQGEEISDKLGTPFPREKIRAFTIDAQACMQAYIDTAFLEDVRRYNPEITTKPAVEINVGKHSINKGGYLVVTVSSKKRAVINAFDAFINQSCPPRIAQQKQGQMICLEGEAGNYTFGQTIHKVDEPVLPMRYDQLTFVDTPTPEEHIRKIEGAINMYRESYKVQFADVQAQVLHIPSPRGGHALVVQLLGPVPSVKGFEDLLRHDTLQTILETCE